MHPSLRLTALVAAVLLALGGAGLALGDDDDDDGEHRSERRGWIRSGRDVPLVTNPAYQEECGACHLAYQPGLLPAAAWQRIMAPDALTDHFGDDASLDEAQRLELAAYLDANAADGARPSRARAFAVSGMSGGPLPRITDTRYFRNEHHELPLARVIANPEIGSLSRCDACHQGAAEGVYNEHQVRIPGIGRWDD